LKIDLANLGPPGKSALGLEVVKGRPLSNPNSKSTEGADSFGQLLLQADRREQQAVESKDAQSEVVPYKTNDQNMRTSDEKATQGQNQRTRESQDNMEANRRKSLGTSREEIQAHEKASKVSSSTNRTQVMLEFMDSMESEFGIPPEMIAGALAGLSIEDLQKPADQTANLVISRLSLAPEDEERAMQLYSGMLAQLQSMPPIKDAFFVPQALSSRTLMLDPRTELNHSIDRMNSKFFMWDQTGSSSKEPGKIVDSNDMKLRRSLDLALDPAQFQKGYLDYSKSEVFGAEVETPEVTYPQTNNMAKSQALPEGQAVESQQTELLKRLSALGAAASALKESIGSELKASRFGSPNKLLNPLQMEGETETLIQDAGLLQMQPQQMSAESELDTQSDSSQAFEDFSKSSVPKDLHQSGSEFFPKTLEATQAQRASVPTAPLSSFVQGSENESMDINQLMNQGKYLIKKGGGEMKIQLSPEGLGKLHMKIIVSEGKVDVQLKTETSEAKKALESSLGELKSSLGAHKLNLEHLRVDVGSKLSENGSSFSDSTQKQPDSRNELNRDQGRDQARDQARQFLGEFRDSNFSQRNFMFDSPKVGKYFSGPAVDPLKPAPIKENSLKRYSGQGKGSGLDLVA
jgi:flagellar hook-length control protein FliK